LISHYLHDVRESLMSPFSGFVDESANSYIDVDKITPLHWKADQLKEMATEAHPPLTITLNGHIESRFMWMLKPEPRRAHGWLQDDRSALPKQKYSLVCIELNKPFILLIPYESVRVHFFHQKLRVVLGKNIADMGTVRIEIGIFGQVEVLAELTVDCLLAAESASDSKSGSGKHDGETRDDHHKDSKGGNGNGKREMSEGGESSSVELELADFSGIPSAAEDSDDIINEESNSKMNSTNIKQENERMLQQLQTPLTPKETKLLNTLVWYEENLHISKKLKPTDSLTITFTVVESTPARVVNTVKLASIHMS